MYPTIILELIDDLKKLPGIGEKNCRTLSATLNNWDSEDLKHFGTHLIELKTKISFL